jgi:hypothetical protein
LYELSATSQYFSIFLLNCKLLGQLFILQIFTKHMGRAGGAPAPSKTQKDLAILGPHPRILTK